MPSTSLHDLKLGDSPSEPTAPRPLFLPKEHGAYALVLAPLAVAFTRGEPTWAGAGFALAAVCAFLAHEPALVVLAHRGARVRREQGRAARSALAVRAVLAIVAGGLAMAWAPSAARAAAAAGVALCVLVAAFVLRGREKSDAGTLLLALAGAAGGVPVALANGWGLEGALLTAQVFAVIGAVSMLTVRELIPKRKRAAGLVSYVGWLAASVAALGIITGALNAHVEAHLAWALVPTLAVTVLLLLLRPPARHLRAVGWSLAAATLAACGLLAFG